MNLNSLFSGNKDVYTDPHVSEDTSEDFGHFSTVLFIELLDPNIARCIFFSTSKFDVQCASIEREENSFRKNMSI